VRNEASNLKRTGTRPGGPVIGEALASRRSFWRTHLLWPAAAWVVGIVVVETSHVDFVIGDLFYDFETGVWPYHHHWLTEAVIHEGGRDFVVLIALSVVVALAGSFLLRRLTPYRKGFAYLFLAMLVSIGFVALGKQLTHIDCPWSLVRYGGDRPYIGLFEARPGELPPGQCFPSGHASGGFAMLAFYFFLRRYAPRWRMLGLTAGLTLGGVYGVAQQARGAHFVSHDLWTVGLVWFSCLGLYLLFFAGEEGFWG